MNENMIFVSGNLVADPEPRTTKAGARFATMRIASTTRRRAGDGQYRDAGTNWYNVVAFNNLAANAMFSLRKGQPVMVWGRLKMSEWFDKDNISRTSADLEAYAIGHDLSRGHTRFTKGVPAWEGDRLSDPAVLTAVRGPGERLPDEEPDPGPDPFADLPFDLSACEEVPEEELPPALAG